MVGGRGVKLDESSSVRKAELFLCLDMDAAGTEAKVRQASAVEWEWLPEQLINTLRGAVLSSLGGSCGHPATQVFLGSDAQ